MDDSLLIKQYSIESYYHNLLINENDPMRRKLLYDKAYNEIFRFFNEYFPEKDSFGFSNNSLLKKIFSGRTVLDFGCGTGYSTLEISKVSKIAYGYDINKSFIKYNTNTYKNIIFVDDNDFEEIIKDNSIDVVFMSEVIEHIHPKDVNNILKKIHKILKPKGMLICLTPHRYTGPHDVSKHFLKRGQKANGLHLFEYTYKDLNSELLKAGFARNYALSTSYLLNFFITHKRVSFILFHNIYLKNLLEILAKFIKNKFFLKLIKIDSIFTLSYK